MSNTDRQQTLQQQLPEGFLIKGPAGGNCPREFVILAPASLPFRQRTPDDNTPGIFDLLSSSVSFKKVSSSPGRMLFEHENGQEYHELVIKLP